LLRAIIRLRHAQLDDPPEKLLIDRNLIAVLRIRRSQKDTSRRGALRERFHARRRLP